MNCLGSAGYFALDFKHFGPLEAAMGRSNMDQGHSIGKGEGTLPLSPACAPLLLQVKMSLAATTDQTSPCLNRAGLGWELWRRTRTTMQTYIEGCQLRDFSRWTVAFSRWTALCYLAIRCNLRRPPATNWRMVTLKFPEEASGKPPAHLLPSGVALSQLWLEGTLLLY